MNRFFKTASIVTSGIIVGAIVRKIADHSLHINKQTAIDSIKSVKHVFNRNSIANDLDNYFV